VGRPAPQARIDVAPENHENMADKARIREMSFEIDPIAQLVVDATGRLSLVNERARALFGLSSDDVGRPFQDLEVSFRPTDLRSAIQEAYVERHPAFRRDISWPTSVGEPRYLDAHVIPMTGDGGAIAAVKINFVDTTRYRRLQEELQTSKAELETAYEELQSSNEELETTNEELQHSNEELQTTNEEFQTTNEELETSREELRASNDDLLAYNRELQKRIAQVGVSNDDLHSCLQNTRSPIVLVDANLRIRRLSRQAERLLGLGQHDIGRAIGCLRTAIQAPDLEQTVSVAIGQVLPTRQRVRSTDGSWYTMCITPARTAANAISGATIEFVETAADPGDEVLGAST
jgi:two-component system CheB/CheR fusion protein